MWYQQGYDILLQCWSGPQQFVSCFAKKSEKNEEERNNQWLTFNQWDLLPNQHQRMHGEQEETKHSRKGHERECFFLLKNAQDNITMSQSWSRQKLAHLVNSIGNVQRSNNKINYAANQSSVKRGLGNGFPLKESDEH